MKSLHLPFDSSIRRDLLLLFLTLVGLLYSASFYGQSAVMTNDGAYITVTSGANVQVQGEIRNQESGGNTATIDNEGSILTEHSDPSNAPFINADPSSTVQGNGLYRIQGDWVNDGSFDAGNGEVILEGGDQSVSGDSISSFNDLTLGGTGTKTLELEAEVTNVLDLADRRLHTDTNSLFVLDPDPNSIIRAGSSTNEVEGFVSSDSTGWLVRNIDQSSTYLFPVGDSISTPRYAPAELTPSSSGTQTVRVRFVNQDPSLDGYDVLNKESGLGPVDTERYWRIDRPSGSIPTDVELFYDRAVDSADMAVHWDSQWEGMGSPNKTSNASPQLSSIAHSEWNSFSPNPFTLAKEPLTVDAGADTSVCEGSDFQLNATVNGGSGPYGFEWTPATNLDDPESQSPIAQNVSSPITYYVTVHDSSTNTTSQQDSITLDIVTGAIRADDDARSIEPGASHTIEVGNNDSGVVGDSVIIRGPERGDAYWVFGGIRYEAPEETGPDSLTYRVCDARCPSVCDTAQVRIDVDFEEEELFIPNGVSADGDGFNDVWEIDGLRAYPDNSVKIYNRWGDEVFSAAPYQNDWQGQGKNGDVVEGTYFYVLDLGPGEETRTGYIEFRR